MDASKATYDPANASSTQSKSAAPCSMILRGNLLISIQAQHPSRAMPEMHNTAIFILGMVKYAQKVHII
jgi:hypothetical protein